VLRQGVVIVVLVCACVVGGCGGGKHAVAPTGTDSALVTPATTIGREPSATTGEQPAVTMQAGPELSLEQLHQAAKIKPLSGTAQIAYANALASAGKTGQAIDVLAKYTSRKTTDLAALTELAGKYQEQAETFASAKRTRAKDFALLGEEKVLRRMRQLSPSDVSVIFDLGQTADSRHDVRTAVSSYRSFLRLAPRDLRATVASERLADLGYPAQ
jgi:Flp pilus assembly protein TadD